LEITTNHTMLYHALEHDRVWKYNHGDPLPAL